MGQFHRASPATILVVESEDLVLLELADWLRDNGLVALTAHNADDAIALLESHPEIEIMMTDVNMPGSMDGIRLAHHVRDRWPPVKIVIASGRLHTQLDELPDGALFLPKPIERVGLSLCLARVLGGQVAAG
jgi:DNA-binding NtrC family response regulator